MHSSYKQPAPGCYVGSIQVNVTTSIICVFMYVVDDFERQDIWGEEVE